MYGWNQQLSRAVSQLPQPAASPQVQVCPSTERVEPAVVLVHLPVGVLLVHVVEHGVDDDADAVRVRAPDERLERRQIAEARLHVARLGRPVAVIAGVEVAVGADEASVGVGVGRREPDRAHAELVEVAGRRSALLDAGEVAALRSWRAHRRLASGCVVGRIAVAEAIGEGEVEEAVAEVERLVLDPERHVQVDGGARLGVGGVDDEAMLGLGRGRWCRR